MPDSLLFHHISHPGFPGASSGYSSCFLQTIFRCEAFCMLVVVSPSHEQGITEQPITRTTTQLCSIFWNCSASVQSCSALLGSVQHCSSLFGTVRHCSKLFGTTVRHCVESEKISSPTPHCYSVSGLPEAAIQR